MEIDRQRGLEALLAQQKRQPGVEEAKTSAPRIVTPRSENPLAATSQRAETGEQRDHLDVGLVARASSAAALLAYGFDPEADEEQRHAALVALSKGALAMTAEGVGALQFVAKFDQDQLVRQDASLLLAFLPGPTRDRLGYDPLAPWTERRDGLMAASSSPHDFGRAELALLRQVVASDDDSDVCDVAKLLIAFPPSPERRSVDYDPLDSWQLNLEALKQRGRSSELLTDGECALLDDIGAQDEDVDVRKAAKLLLNFLPSAAQDSLGYNPFAGWQDNLASLKLAGNDRAVFTEEEQVLLTKISKEDDDVDVRQAAALLLLYPPSSARAKLGYNPFDTWEERLAGVQRRAGNGEELGEAEIKLLQLVRRKDDDADVCSAAKVALRFPPGSALASLGYSPVAPWQERNAALQERAASIRPLTSDERQIVKAIAKRDDDSDVCETASDLLSDRD